MKKIEEMTEQEILSEVREFETKKFDQERNFIFVSYSHRDSKVVLKTVLKWIRDGYNVAIDLDFQNHSSDENWIRLMEKRLSDIACVKVVCFRSEHYYFSYASLIELMLMRSDYLRRKRISATYKDVPIDIIELSKAKKLGEDRNFDEIYNEQFEKMQREIGNNTFFRNKPKEKEELKFGLDTLCKSDDVKNVIGTSDECIENIESAFEKGKRNFYSYIQSLFENWFVANDLNGNYKDINANLYVEFDGKEVYKFPTSSSVDTSISHNNTVEENKIAIKQENDERKNSNGNDVVKEIKPNDTEAIREKYWEKLNEVLSTRSDCKLQVKYIRNHNYCAVKGNLFRGIEVQAGLTKKRIHAYLWINKDNNKPLNQKIFDVLVTQKECVEAELSKYKNVVCAWERDKGSDNVSCGVEINMENVDFTNESDWSTQHEFLADAMILLDNKLVRPNEEKFKNIYEGEK